MNDELEALRKINLGLYDEVQFMRDRAISNARERNASEARVAELVKVLEPFARAVESDATTLSGWRFGVKPKHEHFVAARRVLDKV